MSITGDNIKKRRLELGMTLEDLAVALGVNRSTVFRYEKGAIEKLPAYSLPVIAKALHCSTDYLMGWRDSPADEDCSSPLSALSQKYGRLDSIDQAKVDGFIDALLMDEKYVKKAASV